MAITDDLISFWELEEASGTRVDAVTGTANDLTDNNTVTQAAGKVGNAALFTGGNAESLSRADNASLSVGGNVSFALCGWVYLLSTTAGQGIVWKYAASGNGEYFLLYNSASDRFHWRLYGADGDVASYDVNADNLGSPADATWYFFYVDHDAANDLVRISINDGTKNTFATGNDCPPDGTGPFVIGTLLTNETDARIDQVGFWKGRVLTDAEITYMYNSGSGRSYADLVGVAGMLKRHPGMDGMTTLMTGNLNG